MEKEGFLKNECLSTFYIMKSKNSAGKSSEADIVLKTWYLEDHYTNIFCQGAWFKMWEKWWKKLDLVWNKKLTLGELVWFLDEQFDKITDKWLHTKYEAKSYYRKLRNVFSTFWTYRFSKKGIWMIIFAQKYKNPKNP